MLGKLLGITLLIVGLIVFNLYGRQVETKPLWQTSIKDKIYSNPIKVDDHIFVIGGDKGKRQYKIFDINEAGRVVAESMLLSVLPFQPLVFEGMIVVGDHGRKIRGFKVPGLTLEWENGTPRIFKIAPMKISKEHFLVQSDFNVLFCLNSSDGAPVWDQTFSDTLINYAAGDVVVCLHTYPDLKPFVCKATALDINDGSILWTITESIGTNKPLFVRNLCILTTTEGGILVVDQISGKVINKPSITGLNAVEIIDDKLILLTNDSKTLVCLSLIDGKNWTITLTKGYSGVAKYSDKLLIADKKSLHCINADNGTIYWTKQLGGVYNTFPFRKGVFLTHKDSFFSSETYGSYYSALSEEPVWVAFGRNIFLKPLVTSSGDLLTSYNGGIRMMPSP